MYKKYIIIAVLNNHFVLIYLDIINYRPSVKNDTTGYSCIIFT